jgi:outer membrane protein TolC
MTTAELLKAADHEAFLRDDQRAALARVLGEGERRVYGPPTEEQPAGWPEREILEDLLSALRLRNPEARAGMGDEAASRRVRPG